MKKYLSKPFWIAFWVVVILKIVGVVTFSWWWITAPFLIASAIFFLGLIGGIIFYQFTKYTEKRR